MSTILILYTTTEGQTARIADRIAQKLRNGGHGAETYPAREGWSRLERQKYDGAIVGAWIHYGRHPADVRSLVRDELIALQARPSAFFSVSASAGGAGAKPATARHYLEVFLRQTGWQPRQTAAFAGAIQ